MIINVDPVIGHAASAALALIFLQAAVEKLRAPEVFLDAVQNYKLLPASLNWAFARVLPIAELAAALGLLFARPLGAPLALALLAIVTAGVLVNVLRGRTRIDCGCGGDQHLPLGPGLLARNAVLMALALLATLPVAPRATVWLDPVAAIAGALALIALYALANGLLRNHSRLIALRNAP
ncbi:MauE/DoxX family redox-associated membrane protein [Pelomonas sp. KK5]|uniref:MauE/DoxX family redox-associated membrane protein n=1 Tax=Pelomonas sp. KK5 TaxID=1855730 RepID=UPI00097C304C|nr:MauE/DoxX family redox-associated membrane protein [Pelomonas sp. KK5]